MRKFLLIFLAVLAIDIIVSVGFYFYTDSSLPKWDGECHGSSYLVVFYGGSGWSTNRRIDVAQRLLKECSSQNAILVGGGRPNRRYWGSERMKTELINRGITGSRLLTERRSYDSLGNIREMLTLLKAQKAQKAILVSDPPHLYRLLHIAAKMGDNVTEIETVSAYPLSNRLAYVWRPHYEAIAWLSLLLPTGIYDQLLRQFRR